jgi:hypothetical protein
VSSARQNRTVNHSSGRTCLLDPSELAPSPLSQSLVRPPM